MCSRFGRSMTDSFSPDPQDHRVRALAALRGDDGRLRHAGAPSWGHLPEEPDLAELAGPRGRGRPAVALRHTRAGPGAHQGQHRRRRRPRPGPHPDPALHLRQQHGQARLPGQVDPDRRQGWWPGRLRADSSWAVTRFHCLLFNFKFYDNKQREWRNV
jgi:hypothetical protein